MSGKHRAAGLAISRRTPVDPFAEAMARGVAVKKELLERAGGGLTSSQVARALGVTRQAVDKRRLWLALLAVPSGSGEYLYPACQFTGSGVVPGLERTLRAFPINSPWTQLSALIEPARSLGGRTVLAALQAGDTTKALDLVAGFGEQGGVAREWFDAPNRLPLIRAFLWWRILQAKERSVVRPGARQNADRPI